jgi:hypothetical protein
MKILSSSQVKIIACLVMLIDHVGAILFPNIEILRWIGRLTFPLFAWQFAVSWDKTSNRQKYTRNLFVFAVISQIPYSVGFNRFSDLNIIFLFVLGAGTLALYSLMGSKRWIGWILFVLAGAAAYILRVDYGFYGIMAIAVFYFYKDNLFNMLIGYSLLSVLGMVYFQNNYQWVSLFSVLIIAVCDQTLCRPKLNKWLFYAFYPAHILLLAAISFAVKGF